MKQTDLMLPAALLRNPDGFGGRPTGDLLRGRPIWRDGQLAGLDTSEGDAAQIVLPKLVEVHCHLDKCHTIGRLGPVGGDLETAIESQKKDKANWTVEDLQARAMRGLAECRAAGVAQVRSHVDWGDGSDPPLSWQALTGLDAPEVQWAALTGIDQLADADFADAVAGHVARSGGVLGGFLLHHDEGAMRRGLANVMSAARRHDLMLDFHVDEGLGGHNGLERVADAALEARFDRPILCGHAVSLMNRGPDDVARIADKLARAGIAVCALPFTNLYLQGRSDGTPDRRGITRLRELRAAGVTILTGSDNVGDAFCPVGQHDPMAALHQAALTAHLDPPLGRWLPMITTDAARALGCSPVTLDGAAADDLLFYDTDSLADVISGRARPQGATP